MSDSEWCGIDAALFPGRMVDGEAMTGAPRQGTWGWNPMTGDFHLSEQAARILRMESKHHRMTYDGFLAVIYAPDRRMVDGCLKRAVVSRSSLSIDFRVKRPDGTLGILSLWGATGEAPQPAGFPPLSGIMEDITVSGEKVSPRSRPFGE